MTSRLDNLHGTLAQPKDRMDMASNLLQLACPNQGAWGYRSFLRSCRNMKVAGPLVSSLAQPSRVKMLVSSACAPKPSWQIFKFTIFELSHGLRMLKCQ